MKTDILEVDLFELVINFKIKFIQRIKDMHKALQLQHEAAKYEGEPIKFGALKQPPHYAFKKAPEGSFFICWDGERSDYTENPYEALKWAKANHNYKTIRR